MEKFFKRACVLILPLLLTACASTVVTTNPNVRKGGIDTFGLTTDDFDYAAKKSLDDFMMSPWLGAKKGRLLVQIGNVRNETTQEIDTKRLTRRMIGYMERSGKFMFTAAAGSFADGAVKDYRQLEKSDLYDQDSGAKGGALKPDLSMIGEISQTTNVSANRGKQQLEYEFFLQVTDLGSGAIVFRALVPIDKLGSNQNFSW